MQAGREDEDGSCFSSTLSKTVPEESCVEARSNGVWYRGVEGNGESGPYGACVEKHPLP